LNFDKNESYKRIPYFVLSAAFAVISSFSSGQGLMVWTGTIVVWLLARRQRAFRDPLFYIWCGLSFIVFFLFYNFVIRPSALVSDEFSFNLYTLIHFYFRFLGNIAANSLFGLMVFALSMACIVDFICNNRKDDIFATCLIVTGLLVALQIAIGRSDFGPLQASTSRYVIYSSTLILYCLFYIRNKDVLSVFNHVYKLKSISFKILTCFFWLVVCLYFIIGLANSSNLKETLKLNQFYLRTFDSQPLKVLFHLQGIGHTDTASMNLLKAHKLNVFHGIDKLATVEPQSLIQISEDQNIITLSDIDVFDSYDDPYISVAGAAIDRNDRKKFDSVFILLNDIRFECYYGRDTESTAKLSSSKRYKNSGFMRYIPIRLLPEGSYDVKFQLFAKDETVAYETKVMFVINIASDKVEIYRNWQLPQGDDL
jgi:hypothetical protein